MRIPIDSKFDCISLKNKSDSLITESFNALSNSNWWQSFRYVTFPMIKHGMLVGAIFAFSFSFDEIIIALFLTDFETFTLPKQLYDELRYQMKPTIAAASTFVIVISLLLLTTVALIQRRMARGQARVEPDS